MMTVLYIANSDCSVIYSKKYFTCAFLPFLQSFTFWKIDKDPDYDYPGHEMLGIQKKLQNLYIHKTVKMADWKKNETVCDVNYQICIFVPDN